MAKSRLFHRQRFTSFSSDSLDDLANEKHRIARGSLRHNLTHTEPETTGKSNRS